MNRSYRTSVWLALAALLVSPCMPSRRGARRLRRRNTPSMTAMATASAMSAAGPWAAAETNAQGMKASNGKHFGRGTARATRDRVPGTGPDMGHNRANGWVHGTALIPGRARPQAAAVVRLGVEGAVGRDFALDEIR